MAEKNREEGGTYVEKQGNRKFNCQFLSPRYKLIPTDSQQLDKDK